MAATFASRAEKLGMSPGSIVHVGARKTREAELNLTVYGAEEISERIIKAAELPEKLAIDGAVAWLDVAGVHDVELIRAVGRLLGVHSLVLEDIANTRQRPKVEFHPGYIFATMRVACQADCRRFEELEQVSFILGRGCLITFREQPGKLFDPVRERLKVNEGRLRRRGADYLMYELLDLLVDQYFVSVEDLSGDIERLEDGLFSRAQDGMLRKMHAARDKSRILRRAAWPLREVVQTIARGESELLSKDLSPYLKDLTDHAVQVAEMLEVQRETIASQMDIYLTVASNRMNRTMTFLTVIATIFIPLPFIVGIYGMNFEYMPELKWRYGYHAVWAVMIATAAGLSLWFRKNRLL